MTQEVQVRLLEPTDLKAVATIFAQSFPESLEHYLGDTAPRRNVFVDLFGFVARAEPRAFRVAVLDNEVVGYAVTPSSITGVYRAALATGFLWDMVRNTLSGAYGLTLRAAFRIAVDKLRMGLAPVVRTFRGGQILSIAVLPRVRGQGVAQALLRASLEYLQERRVKQVKLEVRPENSRAHHIYEKLGFEPTGRVFDSQGSWIVMVREL